MKILIIEDDLNLGFIIADLLIDHGHDTLHVTNGMIAFGEFKKFCPEIVLMDVNLNCDINGFEIARQIRTCSMTPVIFITNKSEIRDMREGYDIGNVDYLKKPLSYNELMLRANELIGRQKPVQVKFKQKYELGNYTFLPNEKLLIADNMEMRLNN
jgi:DNA-binding response OmpR family regulator